MLEMLSWIADYGIDRKFEDLSRRGIYLQATDGSSPNIVGRPGWGPNAMFKLVPVYIAKENFKDKSTDHEHGFAIISSLNRASEPNRYFFVAVEDYGNGLKARLKEDALPQPESTFSIWTNRKAKTLALMNNANARLWIKPSSRAFCGCGCITQDDTIIISDLNPTKFGITVA
jgi:hypothetical protein